MNRLIFGGGVVEQVIDYARVQRFDSPLSFACRLGDQMANDVVLVAVRSSVGQKIA